MKRKGTRRCLHQDTVTHNPIPIYIFEDMKISDDNYEIDKKRNRKMCLIVTVTVIFKHNKKTFGEIK